jgi:hypothetical protein
MRADKRRLALIERGLASPWTKFRRADGAAVLVPDRMAIDAFLNAIGGRPLGMGDAAEAFLAECEVDERAPDVEYLVVAVARQHAGQQNAAPAAPNAPLGSFTSPTRDQDEDPEAGDGGIGELLLEEERLVRAARSQEWIETHLGSGSPRGADADLGAN